MSCYEWEGGTIALPTSEAVRVRNAMKVEVDRYKTQLYERAAAFWKELPAAYKRDSEKYHRAVQAFVYGNVKTERGWLPDGLPDPKLPPWREFSDEGDYNTRSADIESLLSAVCWRDAKDDRGVWHRERTTPRRVTKPDVDKLVGKATGTKFSIACGEPSIRFEGRKVVWTVPENNHACEHARVHPLAEAFFKLLDGVRWTRGSGGVIVGNNEYNRDDQNVGGGGNYVVSEYGPPTKRPRRGRR